MGRGRYPARIKIAPPDQSTAEQYLLAWRNVELYTRPERFPPITSEHVFGNHQPLMLDIGCGTGEEVCERAARAPQINYIGVDHARKPLYMAVAQATARSLANIKFLHADFMLLYPLLKANTLQTVFVHFPIPATNAQQRKHSMLTPAFLDQIHRALVAGGRLSVLTDNDLVFSTLMALLRAEQRFEVRPKTFVDDVDCKSYYQRRWERRGRAIRGCELVKIC